MTKILLSLAGIALFAACTGAKDGAQFKATDFSDSTAVAVLDDDGISVTLTKSANNEDVATLRWSKKHGATTTMVRTDDGGQRLGTLKATFAANDASLASAAQSLHAVWTATHAQVTPTAVKTMDCEWGGYCGASGDNSTTCTPFYNCDTFTIPSGCPETDTVCVQGFADCSTFTQTVSRTWENCVIPM